MSVVSKVEELAARVERVGKWEILLVPGGGRGGSPLAVFGSVRPILRGWRRKACLGSGVGVGRGFWCRMRLLCAFDLVGCKGYISCIIGGSAICDMGVLTEGVD